MVPATNIPATTNATNFVIVTGSYPPGRCLLSKTPGETMFVPGRCPGQAINKAGPEISFSPGPKKEIASASSSFILCRLSLLCIAPSVWRTDPATKFLSPVSENAFWLFLVQPAFMQSACHVSSFVFWSAVRFNSEKWRMPLSRCGKRLSRNTHPAPFLPAKTEPAVMRAAATNAAPVILIIRGF